MLSLKPLRSGTDTTLIRFFSIILIANSHLESLYPKGKSWMAADGMLGGAWFFLISGFSLAAAKDRPFGDWFGRRFMRIYPAMWLAIAIFAFGFESQWRYWGSWSIKDWFFTLLWPIDRVIVNPDGTTYHTGYPFIWQIMPMYVLFYFILKPRSIRLCAVASLFSGLGCAVLVALHAADLPAGKLNLGIMGNPQSMCFFFMMMMLGAVYAMKKQPDWSKNWSTHLALAFAVFLAYAATKYMMVVKARGTHLFGLLYVFTAILGWQILRLGQSEKTLDLIRRFKPVHWLIGLVGALTLEIYVVHIHIAENHHVESIKFPLNLAVFWIGTIIVSTLVGWLTQYVQKKGS